jgi:hypothetical protein
MLMLLVKVLYALNQIQDKYRLITLPIKKEYLFANTQFEDGSWNFKVDPILLYRLSKQDFLMVKNQFISAAGTNWASMALTLAVK